MDPFTNTLARRLLLSLACWGILAILLAREFEGGFLTNYELVFALVAIGLGMGLSALLIGIKTFKSFGVNPQAQDHIVDDHTRRRRLLAIRSGKAMIALLTIALVTGLIRGGPFLPVLVGVIMNLWITLSLVWWIARLQRTLK